MAYIFGRITKKEAAKLRAAGWNLEEPEKVLESMADVAEGLMIDHEDFENLDDTVVGIYVDSSLFEVITGPDWEKVKTAKKKKKGRRPMKLRLFKDTYSTAIIYAGHSIGFIYPEDPKTAYLTAFNYEDAANSEFTLSDLEQLFADRLQIEDELKENGVVAVSYSHYEGAPVLPMSPVFNPEAYVAVYNNIYGHGPNP